MRISRFEPVQGVPVARKLPRDISTEIFTKIVPVRAVNFSIGPFCTEFRCEQLCDDDIFRDRGQLLGLEIGLRDINTEIVTKIVPVRAVNISTGPFCTEFRCEHFCDDFVFWIRVKFLISQEKGRREICGALDHTIFHRIPARIQP